MLSLISFNIPAFIQAIGLAGVFVVIFMESGLLIGFFLPGDSLLFTAGFLASQGYLDLALLIALAFAGAVLGDTFGYLFGRQVGPALFRRDRARIFNPENLKRSREFYDRHGGKTIILARFMPVVRTFVPILAGVGRMRYLSFLFYNIIGAALWTISLPFLGYYLGKTVPNTDHYILFIVGLVIILSVIPAFGSIIRRSARSGA